MAEQEFVDALACFFYKQRGIFIHSLKLDEHLKVLTNKAREHRRQNKNIAFELTEFETKLADLLNISSQTFDDIVNTVVSHLLKKPKAIYHTRINGKVVRESIDEKLKGNDRMYVMKISKPAKDYTIDEVKDGIRLGKFESECRVAGENDLFIMLPDSKFILCVERKRHLNCKDQNIASISIPSIDRNLFSASFQLKKNAQFISSKHGAIISPDWRFAKIAAISPSVHNPDKICSHCKKFILTTEIVKNPGELGQWWKETGLSERSALFGRNSRKRAYREFQHFFNRVVCMSAVRVVPDPFHTWAQVQGNKQQLHMAAGHTQATLGVYTKAVSDDLDVEEVLKAAHSAYKILFFNKDQMALLTTGNFPSLIFMCDFGAGNY